MPSARPFRSSHGRSAHRVRATRSRPSPKHAPSPLQHDAKAAFKPRQHSSSPDGYMAAFENPEEAVQKPVLSCVLFAYPLQTSRRTFGRL